MDETTLRILKALHRHRMAHLERRKTRQDHETTASGALYHGEGEEHDEEEAFLERVRFVSESSHSTPSQIDTILRTVLQFAYEASKLDPEDVEFLTDFLCTPQRKTETRETLYEVVSSKLENFYEAETAMSGESQERLAAPSGREDAGLGIILHCQSKSGNIEAFWDHESRTIQCLLDKGLTETDVFAFDWHWRAGESARAGNGKASCPATKWTNCLRSLHDNFSSDLLDTLPLPWIIVGGSCAQKSYHRTLSTRTRCLSFQARPESSARCELKIVLDVRGNGIRRVACFVPHPSAGFYNPTQATDNATMLDATFNFLLWLHGIAFSPYSFAVNSSEIRPGIPGAAPLEEIWHYNSLEESQRLILSQPEYTPSFLSWAATYLSRHSNEQVSDILLSGRSLVKVIIAILRTRMAEAYARKSAVDGYSKLSRRGNAAIYRYEYQPFWDGEGVRITKKGYFSIFTEMQLEPLQLFGGRRLYEKWQTAPQKKVTIRFLSGMVLLVHDEEIIFKKTVDSIQETEQSSRWATQIEREIAHRALLSMSDSDGDHEFEKMAAEAHETTTRTRRSRSAS